MTPLPFQPVIILGAGRSGTNILRDVLTALPGITTWPCDEIQPIWRHGNLGFPNDEMGVAEARPDVIRFIRRAFLRLWQRQGRPPIVVEKTCANTLRVPFVSQVLPEARYLVITRHGGDVIPSAVKRWRGDLEVQPTRYFAAKARYIPVGDLPHYAGRFLKNRWHRKMSGTGALRHWGPLWQGMAPDPDRALEEICADQWVACVSRCRQDLAQYASAEQVHTIRYEDFITAPDRVISESLAWLGVSVRADDQTQALSLVRRRADWAAPVLSPSLEPLLRPELHALGYGD